MAPSAESGAWNYQASDAKRALADDKFDDCMSCRITGMGLLNSQALLIFQALPRLSASVDTATTRE